MGALPDDTWLEATAALILPCPCGCQRTMTQEDVAVLQRRHRSTLATAQRMDDDELEAFLDAELEEPSRRLGWSYTIRPEQP